MFSFPFYARETIIFKIFGRGILNDFTIVCEDFYMVLSNNAELPLSSFISWHSHPPVGLPRLVQESCQR